MPILHNLGILKEGQTYNEVTKTNGRVSSVGEKVTDMYIASAEKERQCTLLACLSERIQNLLAHVDVSVLEEIRLRKGRPLLLDFGRRQQFITPEGRLCTYPDGAYITTQADIERSLVLACGGSVYACQEQIRRGYVTVAGGHRIGLASSDVMEDGEVKSLKDISGMNYRFARQIFGAADRVMGLILQGGKIRRTLIVSPPGCGKTTLLRDIVRQISSHGFKTVIIDERSELAAMSDGVCGYDVGVRTDVLDACPKAAGMMMAVRSMSPQAFDTDEIGGQEDIGAVCTALRCGVSVLASAHATSARALFESEDGRALCSLFEVFVTLSKRNGSGTVEEVCTYDELCASARQGKERRAIC